MPNPHPARLVAEHDRGAMTEHELLTRLVQAAAQRPAGEVAALLTVEQLRRLRALILTPPARPEEMRFVEAGAIVGPVDVAAREGEQQRLYHAGAWWWHAYFAARPAE